MFVLGLVAYNKQKNHLRKGLSQTPVPLWHLRSPRRVKQVALSSPSLNVYVCGVHMQMCVCMFVGICTHLCVQTRSNVESLCHSLFTEAEPTSQLNSEITGTISLACSRDLLAPLSRCWNYRQVAMLPWHLWDTGDLNTGPHAWTASTLSTDPSPQPLSAHFVSPPFLS